MKNELISEITRIEWDMFSRVRNAGGVADCQQDPDTFEVMRRSQVGSWPEELLGSYRDDLVLAQKSGRNLMTEKYAWMMEFSFPQEFKSIKERLPEPDAGSVPLIEEIVAIHLDWKKDLSARYPKLNGKGRPIYSRDDSPWATSFETYLRCELKTYSPDTVKILHAHVLRQKRLGINEAERNLLEQVRHYGYASLEDAEKRGA